MKRYSAPMHGSASIRRFGFRFPHELNRVCGYRGGQRL